MNETGLSHKKEQKASWFWSSVSKHRGLYSQIAIATFLTNLFVFVMPIYILNVYDRVIPNQAIATLWILTIGAIVFFIFDLIARILRSQLINSVVEKNDINLSIKLFHQFLHLKMQNKPISTGTFANYFFEFEKLREFFTSTTIIGLIDFPFIFLFILAIGYIGGTIVIVPLVFIPIILLTSLIIEIIGRTRAGKLPQKSSNKQGILVEALMGLETIKSIVAEKQLEQKWNDAVKSSSHTSKKIQFISSIAANLNTTWQQLCIVGVVTYGVFLTFDNKLTIGGIIAVVILVGRVLALCQFSNILMRLERSRIGLKALNDMMNMPSEDTKGKAYLNRPKLKAHIVCDRLTFNYPNQTHPALNDISLETKPGEKIALVGPIGSGKTTLLKLITGLYQPTSGNIFIEGTAPTEINPHDLRSQFHYASDDSILFNGSIFENIIIANPKATDDEVIKKAQLAGVDKFVKNYPAGYDFNVGERGENLSSGQRQAIILARALISPANVMLLDEPTANFDNKTETEVVRNIKPYLKDHTLIIATHRVPILELVDRIIVLDNSKVIADGPKQQLQSQLSRTKNHEEK